MRVRDDDWTTYLAIRAAWLSFVGGRTQGEIAEQLGVSPAKVHRLIALAQKSGFVKFHIEGRPVECLELEDSLTRRFGLQSCIVAPELGGGDGEAALRSVGACAGQFLSDLLSSRSVRRVGVGMGRTLKAAVEEMGRLARPDLEIVSISGSLTRKLAANPYDVVQRMQERSGGEGFYLPVPYFTETAAEKQVFLAQRSVQDLLGRARQSDVFVIGIGTVEDDGHLVQRGMISKPEQENLRANAAVSDLMGRFLTAEGTLADVLLAECAVGLHFEEIRGSRIVALAGGAGKAQATIAALKTGVITDLVTDEPLARAIGEQLGPQLLRPADRPGRQEEKSHRGRH
ncbi:DNA-binding transcriptional regulator [Roseibium aquae]|uniref:DNA-binding transcriptional regulator n=1 Tax=Roseibium aquae TaxID=1323746 RepID=A0A916TMZ7_9HYPH|nr:sugar-binding transcriptional regulator [Roseibium aquae]GGB57631.1 DNA-binding transcriptional regulator [Roseibium aquae]